MSTDEYVPSEGEMREVWVDDRISREPSRYPHAEAHVPELEAEFDRFLASVRRDAAREALDGLTKHATALAEDGNAESFRNHWWTVAGLAEGYRDTHYPETED